MSPSSPNMLRVYGYEWLNMVTFIATVSYRNSTKLCYYYLLIISEYAPHLLLQNTDNFATYFHT